MSAKTRLSFFSKATMVILVALLAFVAATPALADTLGPNNAGTGADNAAVGTVTWGSPGNITTVGTPYATMSVGTNATTHYLQASNYGFAIPTNATITGIQVAINRMGTSGGSGGMRDVTVALVKGGAVQATNRANTTADWPTSFGVATYGSTSDLWGTTWGVTDINASNFGVVLSARNTSGSSTRTATVDYIQVTVTYTLPDTTPPTVNSIVPVTNPTNAASVAFTVTFSESVTGVATSNFSLTTGGVTGASVASVTGTGTTRTVNVNTGSGDGTIRLDMANGTGVADLAGNPLAGTPFTGSVVTVDKTGPTVTVNQAGAQADPTNTLPINFTVVFSEPVTGFSGNDVSLTGTAGNLAGATKGITGIGPTYNVAVNGVTGTGTVIANIAAGTVTDLAGNGTAASTSTDNSVTYDASAPTVTVDSILPNPTLAGATVTWHANENGTYSVRVGGNSCSTGTVVDSGSYSTSPATVAFAIPAANLVDGSNTIRVCVTDAANNQGSNTGTVTKDSTAPTVNYVDSSQSAGTYGLGDVLTIRVYFTENVNVTGAPQLTLETGTTDRVISCTSGTNLTYMSCTYTVQAGDVSSDLNYFSTSSLVLNGGTIKDAAGNNATLTLPASGTGDSLSDNESLVIDGTIPTVTINQAAGQADPASTQPVNFTVVFSEAINDFNDTADITLTGTAGTTASGVFTGVNINITNTGTNTYNVAVSNLSVAGTLTASVAANAVYDNAQNYNGVSTSSDNTVTLLGYNVTYSVGTNTDGGTGTITSGAFPPAPPTNTINVVGGTSLPFASTPASGSLLSNLQVNGFSVGIFNDYTLNAISSTRTISATFDGGWSEPSANATSGGRTRCNNAGDAYTSNNFYASCPTGYSIIYSNFGLNIPAGSVINYVEVGIEGHTDSTNLAVSMSENGGANFANIIETALSPEPASPDKTIRIGNRTGDDWGIPFSPSSFTDANFRLQVTGTSGGSGSFYMDQIQVKVNYTAPALTVTIDQAAAQADPTNAAPIHFKAVFNYPVSDFLTGDVAFTGSTAPGPLVGAVSQIAPNDGTTYDISVTGMTGSGTVVASIPAGKATNVNGTLNSPSTSGDNTVTYDVTLPTVTIDLQDASDSGVSFTDNITNALSPVFDVTFTETISGLSDTDFSNAGTAGCTSFTVGTATGNTYPVTAVGCAEGTLILRLAAGGVTDTASNGNAQTDASSVTLDRTGPDAGIEQAAGQADPTGLAPINFTATFTETVYGFDGLDMTLGNATVANVTPATPGTTYTVAVSNITGNPVTVTASLAAGKVTDVAGNGNTASTSSDNSVYYDSQAPTASINLQTASDSGISNADNITNATSLVFAVTFDKAVTGLANGDFSNAGTAGCTFTVGTASGNTYPVTAAGCANGTLILRLAAGAVLDGASNPNAQTDGPTVTIDRVSPTVTLNQAAGQADPTNVPPISFTALFNETVYNFSAAGVSTAGSTATGTLAAALTGSGATYNVDITGMTGDGTVMASINANAATDAAGNFNLASTSGDHTVIYDTTAPTVTINQAGGQADPTNSGPVNFTVTFSEAVTGFATGDVNLGSGTAGATTATVSGGPSVYTVAVTGMTNSGLVIAEIDAGKAIDAAGNSNVASTSTDNAVTYDITKPTVTVEQAVGQADPTNVLPIHFTVEFSKPINPATFTNADLSLSSGTATITASSSTVYDVSVSGTVAQGPLTVSVLAGGVMDLVGNTNTASTSTDNVVVYDTIAPTVTINQASGQLDPTNLAPIHFTVVFSEGVTGFDNTDLTLSSGTATVTGSGTTYDVAVTGMAQGILTASVKVNAAVDQVGLTSAASTSTDNSVLYDTVLPTVTVNQEASQLDPTNASPINFTVTFSEPVTGFTNADLVGNFGGTAAPTTAVITTGSGTTYNVAISGMAADGTVTLSLPAGVATDVTGNGNTASTSTDNLVVYDTTRPTVTINQAAAQVDPTNASPINFTVTFSESVTGFTNADVTLTGTAGPTVATVTGGPTVYNVAVSGMTGNGTVQAFVLVNAAVDAAGNNSFPSTSSDNTVTYDIIAPTVTFEQAATQADPTGTTPINFTVVFSESINASTFTGADVTIGGTAGATTAVVASGSGSTFTVAVSGMTQSGTVTASLAAGKVQDLAGNSNVDSTSVDNTVTFDTTAPTVTVNQATSQIDPTNGMPINFTVVFSEAVTGFTSADVVTSASTTPGTLTAVVSGGGTTYNVAISGMTGSGDVIVTIPANAAIDVSGNGNTASTSTDNTVTYDVTRPTVTLEQDAAQPDPTGTAPINFAVVFSEPVSDFATGDVTLGGTAGATTAVVTGGGTTYNVAVSGMTGSGTVSASIAAGKATDASGNTNLASTSLDNTVTYDTATLTVTINQGATQLDPINVGPIVFDVVFSKSVADFASADVLISGTATGTKIVTVSGSGTNYTVSVTGMTGTGTVIATIPANGAHDSANNGNANSTSSDNIVTYDVTAPTVTINQASGQADPTNTPLINFTVVFNEAVTGFATGDVTFGGTAGGPLTGTVTEIAPNNGTSYNVAVTGLSSSGTVIASLLANVAKDIAGNNSVASTSTDNIVTYDVTGLGVTIDQAGGQLDPTNTAPILFTVVFTKPVTDFATGDVTLGGSAGATTATVSGSGTTYTVSVTGMANTGTVIASLAAGVAHDSANNPSAASTSTDNTVQYDITLPTVTINQAGTQLDPTNAGPINFTAVFSEPVTGFVGTDVLISGTATGVKTATVTQIAPNDGTTYNVAISGMTGTGTVIATIPANSALDAANNGNANSTTTDNVVTYDVTAPTVTINQATGQADPTNSSPINFTVVFSEAVTGFATGDVTLGGTAGGPLTGTVTEIAPLNGTTYNVAVSGMSSTGTVIASLATGVAKDAAGNNNAASTSSDNLVTFDVTGLGVTIEQAASQLDPTNASPILFTVIFTKPVTDFATGDVTLGGSAGATTAVVSGGPSTYTVSVTGMANTGTVIASLAEGVAHDASGNPSAASTSTDNTVLYDITVPTVTINQALGQADPTNAGPINFTAIFSEPVTGFAGTDVVITGTATGTKTATVTEIAPNNGTTYNVAINGMTGSGTVIVAIPANSARDVATNGNANSTSTDNTVEYDITRPTVTINQATGQLDPTNAAPIVFTVTFSEPVSGFIGADVTLTGTAGATTAVLSGGPATYDVLVSGMTASGTVIANLQAGVVVDAAGNTNLVSTSTDNQVTFDNTALTVTINQAAGQLDPTNASPINFTVAFSKPVTGFTGSDVRLSGTAGATTAVVSGGPSTYTVAVSGMAGTGTVIAAIPASAAQDASGNGNLASTSTDDTVSYDITVPTVTINQAAGQVDPTNASPITFTVVFSEPVTGFTGTDVAISGTAGATTATVSGGPTTYTVTVSGMAGSGAVTVIVPAGNVTDAAGNTNTNSTSTDNTVTYDVTVPAVTINQSDAQADPTNASPIYFTVSFGETVNGFTEADVILGGTAGATTAVVSGGPATYTVAVIGMSGSGTVTATVPAGAATDLAGNVSPDSTSSDNIVTFDNSTLTVTINQAASQADPTNASPINFTVIFNKPVTGFTGNDVLISGTAGATTAVATNTSDGSTYNVAISGMVGSGTVIATIPAGIAQDGTANVNTASTSADNMVLYDITVPTVTINQAVGQADPTNVGPINFTVVFSEAVTGFDAADVVINGTAGASTATVTGSGAVYTVSVNDMVTSGTVIATVPAGNAMDTAGNANTNSTSTDNSVVYDFTPTPVTINQAEIQSDPTRISPIHFTVVFAKPVTGFENGDVVVSGTAGATTANVSGDGTTYDVIVSGMTNDGTVVVTVPAGVATDILGNTNAPSTSTDNKVVYDTTGPSVTINQAVGQPDPASAPLINFTVVFNESVTGFDPADLNLGGSTGADTAVVTGAGTTYNVAVSGMTNSGMLFVTVTDAAAIDAAGNPNVASTSTDNIVRYDMDAPSVTINQAADQQDPTDAGTIKFAVVFSKPVSGFVGADVVLNGTAGAYLAAVIDNVDNTTYTVEVSGMANSGTVVAKVPANRANDMAGNGNLASTSTDNTVVYDHAPVCSDINANTGEDTPVEIAPICVDADGDTLTYGIVTPPTGGSASIMAGNLYYDPSPNFYGMVSFTYKANDGFRDSAPATVTVNIPNFNDIPTGIYLSDNNVVDGSPAGTLVGTLTTADPDLNDIHTYSLVDTAIYSDNVAFEISGNQLLTKKIFKLIDKKEYTIRIQTDDGLGGTFADTFIVTVVPKTVKPKRLVVRSTNIYDGWMLESTETSNRGGSVDYIDPTFRLGDDATNRQYRSILDFDTSALPNNAVITKVTLKIKKQGYSGANPFSTLGNILVDLREGAFGNNNALQLTDFRMDGSLNGKAMFTNLPVNNWFSVNLPGTTFRFVNVSGSTQFRLRFLLDDNNDKKANFLKFYSGNASLVNRPRLIIEYYLP